MIRNFVFALALSIILVGCSERYGGSIFPVPPIEEIESIDNLVTAPTNDQIMDDIEKVYGKQSGAIIEPEYIDVESRIYFVVIDRDLPTETIFKVIYYLLDNADAPSGKTWVPVISKFEL